MALPSRADTCNRQNSYRMPLMIIAVWEIYPLVASLGGRPERVDCAGAAGGEGPDKLLTPTAV